MSTYYQNVGIDPTNRVYTYKGTYGDSVDVTACSDVEVDSQGSTYIFYFNTPKQEWCIDHSLGKYPEVFLRDTSGNQLLADIQYINPNYIIAYFSKKYSGIAYIN